MRRSISFHVMEKKKKFIITCAAIMLSEDALISIIGSDSFLAALQPITRVVMAISMLLVF